VSALVNWFVETLVPWPKTDSIALEAMHGFRADVYTSIGVFAGLGLIALTKINQPDSIAAIVVALLIIKSSIDLTRNAIGDIFDVRL
jgi:divalent metal cation (Fe/Co/Zn/Cd) transporter